MFKQESSIVIKSTSASLTDLICFEVPATRRGLVWGGSRLIATSATSQQKDCILIFDTDSGDLLHDIVIEQPGYSLRLAQFAFVSVPNGGHQLFVLCQNGQLLIATVTPDNAFLPWAKHLSSSSASIANVSLLSKHATQLDTGVNFSSLALETIAEPALDKSAAHSASSKSRQHHSADRMYKSLLLAVSPDSLIAQYAQASASPQQRRVHLFRLLPQAPYLSICSTDALPPISSSDIHGPVQSPCRCLGPCTCSPVIRAQLEFSSSSSNVLALLEFDTLYLWERVGSQWAWRLNVVHTSDRIQHFSWLPNGSLLLALRSSSAASSNGAHSLLQLSFALAAVRDKELNLTRLCQPLFHDIRSLSAYPLGPDSTVAYFIEQLKSKFDIRRTQCRVRLWRLSLTPDNPLPSLLLAAEQALEHSRQADSLSSGEQSLAQLCAKLSVEAVVNALESSIDLNPANSDMVHKRLWRAMCGFPSAQLVSALGHHLRHIQDSWWVLQECTSHGLRVCAHDVAAARALLEYGLSRVRSAPSPTSSDTFWRLVLQHFLHRLSTLDAIHQLLSQSNESSISPLAQRLSAISCFEFCRLDLADVLGRCCMEEEFTLAELLLRRHGRYIYGHDYVHLRCHHLDRVPLTAHAGPLCRFLWTQPDPSPEFLAAVDFPLLLHDLEHFQQIEEKHASSPSATADPSSSSLPFPLPQCLALVQSLSSERTMTVHSDDPSVFFDWLTARTYAIDEETGQASDAYMFLRTALESSSRPSSFHPPFTLLKLARELQLLVSTAYSGPFTMDSSIADLLSADPLTQLNIFLASSTADTVVELLSSPFIQHILTSAPVDQEGPVLHQWLLAHAESRLDLVAAVFVASRPYLPASSPSNSSVAAPPPVLLDIYDHLSFVSLALDCIYSSQQSSQPSFWKHANDIFESLPAAPAHCSGPLEALHRRVDLLEKHLNSAELLSRYSTSRPLRFFLQFPPPPPASALPTQAVLSEDILQAGQAIFIEIGRRAATRQDQVSSY